MLSVLLIKLTLEMFLSTHEVTVNGFCIHGTNLKASKICIHVQGAEYFSKLEGWGLGDSPRERWTREGKWENKSGSQF